jgi:hypothetical protein
MASGARALGRSNEILALLVHRRITCAKATKRLISSYAPGFPGWPLAAFVATGAYLLVVGLEQTAADRQTER